MVNIGTWDSQQHEASERFDPLDAGWWGMQIVESSVEKTKDGAGQYLQFVHEVLENVHPQHRGRRVVERLNIWHKDPTTNRIANGKLRAICEAVGVLVFKDTQELHHRPLAVKLKVRPAEGEYEASNDVTQHDSYAARFGAGAPPPPAPAPGGYPAPAPYAPPSATVTPPGYAPPVPGHPQQQQQQQQPAAPPAQPPWKR